MTRSSRSFLVGLVGNGIGPSLTPPMHEREADELGVRHLDRRFDLDVLQLPAEAIGELLAAARLAGFLGLNATHPCKQLGLRHLDELSPDAALDQVVLLGAGGAGAAVASALLTLGVGRLTVLDVDGARARTLAAALGERFSPDRAAGGDLGGLEPALARADGLVHATPTGMAAHPGLPVPAAVLRPPLWVADVVYRPLETELVRTARAAGCRVLGGGGMAVFQSVDAYRLFTDLEPDAGRMLAHFATLVDGVDARVG